MKTVTIQTCSYVPVTHMEAQVLAVLISGHISLAVSYASETFDITRSEAEYLVAHCGQYPQEGPHIVSKRPVNFVITDNEHDLITQLYKLKEPQKVMAIKFLRGQYPLSLREAKDICDTINS